MPRVSFIMSVHNAAGYLTESLHSLISQRYVDWEAVICDDGSTDGTNDILTAYAALDPRIRVFTHENRTGLAQSLNEAFARSQGELIARHDGDDLARHDRLERQVKYLDEHPEVDVVGSYAMLIDSHGREWGKLTVPVRPTVRDLVRSNCFIHPSVVIRREAFSIVNGYDAKLERAQDYDLWFRLFALGKRGDNLPVPLMYYRWDRDSYRRKTLRHRLLESRIRWHGCRALGIPFYVRFWVLKPLVAGMIPRNLLFAWQRHFLLKNREL